MIVRVTLVCFLLVVVGSPIKSNAEAEADASPRPRPRARPVPIYSNQFAVHVPEGFDAAAEIAEKHGFDNHGQALLRNSLLSSYGTHKNNTKNIICQSDRIGRDIAKHVENRTIHLRLKVSLTPTPSLPSPPPPISGNYYGIGSL
ncbi:hypothetical protein M0804_009504 [Polistes exclamans]|nr:hypothetical protein M0804_009504 [Polistes exclamans]